MGGGIAGAPIAAHSGVDLGLKKVGLLTLDYTNLWLDPRLGARVVAFTPADDETERRLAALQRVLAVS